MVKLHDASSFNQPLNDWRVDKVTDMREMFRKASSFNQDLGWCVKDGVSLDDAFKGTQCIKGCDYIASEPAKVEKRCSRRVGEDGVPALEACKQTCGKC